MSKLTVSKKIEKLPPDARKQAQDFVDFLYRHYVQNKGQQSKSESDKISDSSFFGIWKDREEMSDSVKWVRDTRKSQWPN